MSKTQVALIIVLIGLVVMYFTFFKKKDKTESGYTEYQAPNPRKNIR